MTDDRRRYLDASRKADDLRKQVERLGDALRTVADIAEGSGTLNSLPNIAQIARSTLALQPGGRK